MRLSLSRTTPAFSFSNTLSAGRETILTPDSPPAICVSAMSSEDEVLNSAMNKLVAFIKADQKHTIALSTIFVEHEMNQKQNGSEGEGEDCGLPIETLISEFGALGVGFDDAEAKAFHTRYDENHDGSLSFEEFAKVLAMVKKNLKPKPIMRELAWHMLTIMNYH